MFPYHYCSPGLCPIVVSETCIIVLPGWNRQTGVVPHLTCHHSEPTHHLGDETVGDRQQQALWAGRPKNSQCRHSQLPPVPKLQYQTPTLPPPHPRNRQTGRFVGRYPTTCHWARAYEKIAPYPTHCTLFVRQEMFRGDVRHSFRSFLNILLGMAWRRAILRGRWLELLCVCVKQTPWRR